MARGTLRIYLGSAPGVGKTYAMLDEGQRRSDRGTDVVVGYVETHGRPHTAAKLENLEIIPRRRVAYREQLFEEMDLPAVLARKPTLVLVDELAHTNTPGIEHEKRWQDVEALLEAGIDVISTINLQHLESVNDVVETITGTAQRETVPDAMVRRAEQIQLVDMTPEALRRRLAHGNVYAADRVDAALTNFFRPGNLAALRELALLWLADRVDDELQAYRERHGIDTSWETRERVVVAITGGATSERLIRRASRMATRTHAELVGVHVRSDDGLSSGDDDGLAATVAMLEELGGRYVEVVRGDVAAALVDVARAENTTQLVIGASPQSRMTTLVRGSIVARCVSLARGEFDVHVISAKGESETRRAPRRWRLVSPLSSRRLLLALVLAVVAFPCVTLALLHAAGGSLTLASSVYLLIVVGVAVLGGLIPGLLGAITAFLLVNWYFAPPVHTFSIGDSRGVFALVSYLAAALAVSSFVDLAARRSAAAARAERDARALSRLARHVVTGENALPEMVDEVVRIFELNGALVRRRDEPTRALVTVGTVGASAEALRIDDEFELVIDGRRLGPERQELLVAVTAQLVAALDRRQLEHDAAQRSSLLEADRLRSSLLAAVSHDLRTPLASIKTAATTLLEANDRLSTTERQELFAAIDSEADRLNALVGDLLDVARVEEGTVDLRPVAIDLVEVTDRAIADAQLAPCAEGRSISRTGDDRVAVMSDPVLIERVAHNLIANALIHAPNSAVVVDVARQGDQALLRVIDHGPGIDRDARASAFRPFQRQGDLPEGHGVGLGLALASGFAATLGGELTLDDTPGGGCTMVLSIPTNEEAVTP